MQINHEVFSRGAFLYYFRLSVFYNLRLCRFHFDLNEGGSFYNGGRRLYRHFRDNCDDYFPSNSFKYLGMIKLPGAKGSGLSCIVADAE